jgi:hypothetical protein
MCSVIINSVMARELGAWAWARANALTWPPNSSAWSLATSHGMPPTPLGSMQLKEKIGDDANRNRDGNVVFKVIAAASPLVHLNVGIANDGQRS